MGGRVEQAVKGIGVIIAAAAAFFIGMEPIYQALFVLIAADMISGAARAYVQKNLSSKAAYDGVIKKVGELLLVAVAAYVQIIVPAAQQVPLPEAIATFYVYTEAVSLLENLAACGVPIPQFLKDALAMVAPKKFDPAANQPALPPSGAGREG